MEIYKQKNLCTGCGACQSICPKHCIEMKADGQGFLYPVVNAELCINCKSCQKVCSTYYDKKEQKEKPQVYAYTNPCKETLLRSSSGGLFSALAEKILADGGYVCGAVYAQDFSVKHIVSNSPLDFAKMHGSKYLQSRMGECFAKIKALLCDGKTVLFCGTACQTVGLKAFLGKGFDQLYTVDTVCFGVPSPLVFKEYLCSLAGGKAVKSVNMRDKRNGWKNYGISVHFDGKSEYFSDHKDDLYLRGFIGELYNRPSCRDCPAKRNGYASDITLGDLWGAEEILPGADCKDGISAVLVHTKKGMDLLPKDSLTECDFDLFLKHNPKYADCCQKGEYSDAFWKAYGKKGINAAFKAIYSPSFFKKVKSKLGL